MEVAPFFIYKLIWNDFAHESIPAEKLILSCWQEVKFSLRFLCAKHEHLLASLFMRPDLGRH